MKMLCTSCGEDHAVGMMIEDKFYCKWCCSEALEDIHGVKQVDYSEVV